MAIILLPKNYSCKNRTHHNPRILMIKQRLVLLIVFLCSSLLLNSVFSPLNFVEHRVSLSLYSLAIDTETGESNEFINLGFSAFEYEQAKLQEAKIINEYDLTAILLHWKRFDGLQRTLQYLIHTDLFKEIIIWNNNPTINLTLHHFANLTRSHKPIHIINSKENLKDEAKYRACAEAKTHACFYVDDDYNPGHYLKCLIASFRSDPNLLHTVTEVYTFYTNLVWTYFDSTIDLHSGFSWIGCGSVFLRQYAQHHIQLMHKFFQNYTGKQFLSTESIQFIWLLIDLLALSDVFFSVWLNDISVQMNTVLRQQTSRSSQPTVPFSSTRNFYDHQYKSSVLAIRILEQSLRSDRSSKDNVTFSRQRNRRFPSYVKSPNLNDDFIFYTNLLPLDFENIPFNISHDFQRGTRENLPENPNVKHFRNHSTLRAVDYNLKTCWHTHRNIQSNEFFAIDFLSIQSTMMFIITVAHSSRLQSQLDVRVSFDGLFWVSYRSTNGVYRRKNRTLEGDRYAYLFDSNEFNIGFRSFRYISFNALKNFDVQFQVCEIEIVSKDNLSRIKLDFEK